MQAELLESALTKSALLFPSFFLLTWFFVLLSKGKKAEAAKVAVAKIAIAAFVIPILIKVGGSGAAEHPEWSQVATIGVAFWFLLGTGLALLLNKLKPA